ncbi:MAG: isochorismatase family cysteine hydrolase [Microbacteriaceae bacterium]
MIPTALLVMDVQNDFCHPDGLYGRHAPFAHVPPAAAEIFPAMLAVSRACKARRIPIVTTQLRVLADLDGRGIGIEQFRPQLQELFLAEGFRSGTWGQELVDAFLEPDVAPDYRVEKWGHSAMYLTGMEKILRSLKVERLVLTGLATNGVVEGTARDAVSRGWAIHTLTDCTTAPNRDLHEASLLNLGHLGSTGVAAEFIAELEGAA